MPILHHTEIRAMNGPVEMCKHFISNLPHIAHHTILVASMIFAMLCVSHMHELSVKYEKDHNEFYRRRLRFLALLTGLYSLLAFAYAFLLETTFVNSWPFMRSGVWACPILGTISAVFYVAKTWRR